MKIKLLEIKNITSIEEAKIDFEAAPLSDADVFLISGDCGSGKTTIIDAICLALFHTTPRLKSNVMGGKTSDDGNELTLADPIQMLRKGTLEGFARLTFADNDGKIYTAEWYVSRAYMKANGKLNPRYRFMDAQGNLLASRKREVERLVEEKIALTFDQFRRTTMLAQGEFTNFLFSEDKEKAQILGKLIDDDRFVGIGRKIAEIRKRKEEEHQIKRLKLQGVRLLTADEVAQLEAERAQNIRQAAACEAHIEAMSGKIQWLQKNEVLQGNLTKAQAELLAAHALLQSDAYKAMEKVVNDWDRSAEQRGTLGVLHGDAQQLEAQKAALLSLAGHYRQLLGGMAWNDRQMAQLQAELSALKTFFAAHAAVQKTIGEAQRIEELLNQIGTACTQQTQNQCTLETENRRLKEQLIPQLHTAQAHEQSAKREYEEYKEATARQQLALDAMQLTALNKQIEQLNGTVSWVEHAQHKVDAWLTAQRNREDSMAKLQRWSGSIAALKQALAQLEAPLLEAQAVWKAQQQRLAQQKDTVDKFATQMRAKLKVGDICPVCRRPLMQHLESEETFRQLYEEAEKDERDSREAWEALQKQQTEHLSEKKLLEKSLQDEEDALRCDKSVPLAEAEAHAACQKLGLALSADAPLLLQNLLHTRLAEKCLMLERQQEAQKLQHIITARNQHAETLYNIYVKRQQATHAAKEAITQCQTICATAQSALSGAAQTILEAEQKLAPRIDVAAWKHNWRTQRAAFLQELQQTAKRYNQQLTAQQTLQAEQEMRLTQQHTLQNLVQTLVDEVPAWKSWVADVPCPVQDIQEFATRLSNQVLRIRSEMGRLEKSIALAQQVLKAYFATTGALSAERLEALLHYHPTQIAEKRTAVTTAQQSKAEKEGVQKQTQTQWNEHQQARPALEAHETQETLAQQIAESQSLWQTTQKAVNEADYRLKQDKDNRTQFGELQKEEQQAALVAENWKRLHDLFGINNGEEFQKIALSYILTDLIHAANEHMRSLTDRYQLSVAPGTYTIFVEDAYDGFARRPANTISGGESFMVSLALALALSDVGDKIAANIMFIDEGFGSLSNEPLRRAIHTLRTLQKHAGRRIGIISHVEALKEEIAVQIRLEHPLNSSSSCVEVMRL